MSNARVPATIKGKCRRRFYESVVFLDAVTQAWQLNRQSVSHDIASPTGDTSLEANFKDFVNRLSQFCDVKLGGDFVTAFTVLEFPDRIQYRFACNRTNKEQLEKTAAFVSDLLVTLRHVVQSSPPPPVGLEQILLEKVLAHCRMRVRSYLRAFKAACRECIATQPADQASLAQLRQFKEAAADADFASINTETCEPSSFPS